MAKVTFTSAVLVDFGRNNKGGHANFVCPLTRSVIKAMSWEDMPECVNGGNLTGDLAARNISVIPVEDANSRHAIDLETQRVHKFKVVRLELEGQKGKGTRIEVRFRVEFSDAKGCRKLEEYNMVANKSTIKVEYTPAAVQEELPGTDTQTDGPTLDGHPEEIDTGCVSCNNGIGFEPNGKKHITGEPCALLKKKKAAEAVQ